MDPRVLVVLQVAVGGTLAVGCIVLSCLPPFQSAAPALTMLASAGATFVGRAMVGPGQVSITELEKLAKTDSKPPTPPKP